MAGRPTQAVWFSRGAGGSWFSAGPLFIDLQTDCPGSSWVPTGDPGVGVSQLPLSAQGGLGFLEQGTVLRAGGEGRSLEKQGGRQAGRSLREVRGGFLQVRWVTRVLQG